jgi:osmotically-inducible protein OsmY
MFNFFEKKDSQIQQDVLNELKWDPSINSSDIEVTTKDGIVTLRGNIPHYLEKSLSEDAAQRVGGVRAVVDELEVKMMGSYERRDEDIAEAALHALEWSYAVPGDAVKVVVNKGWVTLSGQTDWSYQKNAAKQAVAQLMGVKGVINDITIKARVQEANVKTRIEDALKRSAENEGRKIKVDVKGDRVTLSGNVHSFYEVADAGLSAWNAPGVMMVENNLKIAQ